MVVPSQFDSLKSVRSLERFPLNRSRSLNRSRYCCIEKRKDRLASRSTAYFFRNTEKRYPYVTTAAAQQQLSSSTAAAAAAAAEAAAAAVVAVEAKAA